MGSSKNACTFTMGGILEFFNIHNPLGFLCLGVSEFPDMKGLLLNLKKRYFVDFQVSKAHKNNGRHESID